MAGTGYPDTRGEIQVATAVCINNVGAFALGGGDAGSLLEQGRKFAFVVGHGYLPK
jgi:hypothetical protein